MDVQFGELADELSSKLTAVPHSTLDLTGNDDDSEQAAEQSTEQDDEDDVKQENPIAAELRQMKAQMRRVKREEELHYVEWTEAHDNFLQLLDNLLDKVSSGRVDLPRAKRQMQRLLAPPARPKLEAKSDTGHSAPKSKAKSTAKKASATGISAYPFPDGMAHSTFFNQSLKSSSTHVGKKHQGKYTVNKKELVALLNVLSASDLHSPTRKTKVLRHDYQNYHSPTKAVFQNYQVQIGGSEFRFKGKFATSITNVVVEPRLFGKFSPGAMLKVVKDMHQGSFLSYETVLLACDDATGHAWIVARGGTAPAPARSELRPRRP